MEYVVKYSGELQYLLTFPKDFDPAKKVPVIFYLHGSGTRGKTPEEVLETDVFTQTGKLERFPFLMVTPICPSNETWFDWLHQLKILVKEIATLKVLGFYRREVSGYVFRETAILSLMGTALGLVFGAFFHQFVVQTAETDAAMFGRTVYPMSYLYAAALSLAFTLLVSLALKGKLRQIDMVESLKAPE